MMSSLRTLPICLFVLASSCRLFASTEVDAGAPDMVSETGDMAVGSSDAAGEDLGLDMAVTTDAAVPDMATPKDLGADAGMATDADMTVTDSGVDMASATVIVPYENQPATHVPIAEASFDAVPSAPGAQSISGFWDLMPSYPNAAISTSADVDAPASADSVLAVELPSGLGSGDQDWWIEGWHNQYLEFDEVYLSLFVKLAGNDFQNNGYGIALGSIVAGLQSPSVDRRLEFFVGGSNSTRDTRFPLLFRIQEKETETVVRTLPQNADNRALLTVGQWHQVEVLTTINTLGSADGTLTVWLDGVEILSYDDIELQTATYPGAFEYFLLLSEWSGPVRASDDTILFDHIRLTGN